MSNDVRPIPRPPVNISKQRAIEEVDIPDPKAPLKPHAPSPPPRMAPDEEIGIADARAEPPAQQAPVTNGKKPTITLSTTVQHRGRIITITATDITVDRFCDLLEAANYAAPAPQQWQTLPDGTPLCPKHSTPMKLRNKQGDEWYSHRVFGPDGEELWCKGYHGKDSPGYEY